MANIQISEELFSLLCHYHLLNQLELDDMIQKELTNKLDSIMKHNYYTASKTSKTKAERDSNYQKYKEIIDRLKAQEQN